MENRIILTAEQIVSITGGRLLCGDPSAKIRNITTSSLEIKGSDLFIPIVGERTDGHKYLVHALEDGAAASLSEREDILHEKPVIRVENSIAALQKIGAYVRKNLLTMPFIGVTGSVGKTTTREMIAAALGAQKKVYTTKKNLNSQVGVPVTVFETETDADIAVLELGMSRFHEMEEISAVACPDMAVITNIGICHLANLKTQENILREKLKILTGLKEGGLLLLNGDDPFLQGLSVEKIHEMGICPDKKFRISFYGTGANCRFRAEAIKNTETGKEFLFVDEERKIRTEVKLSVLADFMVMNAVCAMGMAVENGVDPEKAAASLYGFTGLSGRGQIVEKDGCRWIDDCYNASPASVKGALKTLSDMKVKGRRLVCLADMLETGEKEKEYHREVGEFLASLENMPSVLFLYGSLAPLIGEGAGKQGFTGDIRCYGKQEFDRMKQEISDVLEDGDVILLKGSNSMDLKRLL